MEQEQEVIENEVEAGPDPEVVKKAKDLGWKSPDEWEGDLPDGYMDDPQKWVDRAYNNPVVKHVLSKMETLEKTSGEKLRKIESAISAQMDRQKQAYEAELKRITEAKGKAEEEGDYETYVTLDKREDELRKDAPKDEPKEVEDTDKKVMDRWAAKREWIRSDPVKNAAAGALWEQARREGFTDIQAVLDYVDEGMKKQFVDLREKEDPKPSTEPKVSGGLGLGGGSKTAYSKLPEDAKEAFQRFVKRGVYQDSKEDRETYARDYNDAG